jgi:hypothetical protein
LVLGIIGVLVAGNVAIMAAFLASRLREPEPTLAINGNAASLDTDGESEHPPVWVERVSRVFDGSRRIWSVMRA